MPYIANRTGTHGPLLRLARNALGRQTRHLQVFHNLPHVDGGNRENTVADGPNSADVPSGHCGSETKVERFLSFIYLGAGACAGTTQI